MLLGLLPGVRACAVVSAPPALSWEASHKMLGCQLLLQQHAGLPAGARAAAAAAAARAATHGAAACRPAAAACACACACCLRLPAS